MQRDLVSTQPDSRTSTNGPRQGERNGSHRTSTTAFVRRAPTVLIVRCEPARLSKASLAIPRTSLDGPHPEVRGEAERLRTQLGTYTSMARGGAGRSLNEARRIGARGARLDQLSFQDRPTVKLCTVESSNRRRPASASPRMISFSSHCVLRYSSLVESLSVSMVCMPRPKVQPSRS